MQPYLELHFETIAQLQHLQVRGKRAAQVDIIGFPQTSSKLHCAVHLFVPLERICDQYADVADRFACHSLKGFLCHLEGITLSDTDSDVLHAC